MNIRPITRRGLVRGAGLPTVLPTTQPKALSMALSMALSAALLGGCGSEPLRIRGNDVASGSLDAVWRFQPGGAGGLQARFEGYRATSRQHLADGESVRVRDARLLTGPLDLRQRATVQQGFLGYNHRLFADRPVQLQWFAGVAWSRLRWASALATDPPQTWRWDFHSIGPSGGLRARWQALPALALEAGAAGTLGRWSGGMRHTIDSSQVDLGLALTLAEPVRLRLGWARRSLSAATPGDWNTRFEADTRGPYLGLALEFR
ncbi:MAG: hypothetical protein L6Q75_11740 [Burkholderiaceae bacterium]|nr:hypothetical protein [Burkholderiaceae bacterium]